MCKDTDAPSWRSSTPSWRAFIRPAKAPRSSFARLKALCTKMANSQNEKARKLGVEFLNDWEAIFRVLEHPHLPLTNNIAERILRHWLILRRITHGTRTDQGSKTLAIMTSIFETCRLRNASPLRYVAQTIAARRKGLDVPPLPDKDFWLCRLVGG